MSTRELCVAFLVAVFFLVIGTWRGIPDVLRGGLHDPDSYLRLVRIEAGLKLHHIGALVPRDDSGAGLVLHWSHLLDSILIALAAPFAPLFGWHHALFWTGALSGPASVGLLAAGITWAIAPITERRYRWAAAIAVGLSPSIDGYGQLGVIHHHVLLVLVAVMVVAYALRACKGSFRAAIAAGAWFAFGLWLSPEAWPYGLLGVGALGISWLGGEPRSARALAVLGATLTVLVAAILAVDPPPGATIAFDHVSIVHLVMAVTLFVLGVALLLVDAARVGNDRPRSKRSRLTAPCFGSIIQAVDGSAAHRPAVGARTRGALGIGLAVLLLGGWVGWFPRVALGPAGLSATPGLEIMLSGIREMQPITRPAMMVTMLLSGVIGVAVAAWLAWQRRSVLAAYGAFCGVVALALALRYVRFAPYPEALGAAMLPVALAEISRPERRFSDLSGAVLRVGLLAFVLLVPRLAPALDPTLVREAALRASAPNCHVRHLVARLAPYAGEVVLASVNATPELLYWTHVETVGSLYQRGIRGFLRLRAAWRSPPGRDIPAAVRATGARLILFCPSAGRSSLLQGASRTTLADRLAESRLPPWLRELWRDKASGNVLYQINPDAIARAVYRSAASSPKRNSRNTATRFEFRSSSG